MRQSNIVLTGWTRCSKPLNPMWCCCCKISQAIRKERTVNWMKEGKKHFSLGPQEGVNKCCTLALYFINFFHQIHFYSSLAGYLGWIQHTNLQLSHSESLLSRLLRDQRERRLGEGLRDQEREGGRRRSCEGLSSPCSSPSIWLATEGDGEGLRCGMVPFAAVSSITICVFLPHCRLGVQPWSSSFRFLVRVLLRWNRPWRPERDSLGLGERDQDSVSEDGGRTVSVGTGTGCARVIPSGPTGEDIVIFRAFQGLMFSFSQVKGTNKDLLHLQSWVWPMTDRDGPVMLACDIF